MSEKIQIQNCNLPKQKMLETKVMEIELFEDSFKLRMTFKAEEQPLEDDYAAWVEVRNDLESIFPKSVFCGLEKTWLQEHELWKIIIRLNGVGQDLKVFFEKRKECEEVFGKLRAYFFGVNDDAT